MLTKLLKMERLGVSKKRTIQQAKLNFSSSTCNGDAAKSLKRLRVEPTAHSKEFFAVNLQGDHSESRLSLPVKIAGFDMDWTLIRTRAGNTFPKNAEDWLPLYDTATKLKLRELHADDFVITIFTNQAGVASGRTKITELTQKFEAMQSHFGIPMLFIASTAKESEYRKPKLGMWRVMQDVLKIAPSDIDMARSFYCGDAAGRLAPKKDFSNDDVLFALNLGVTFYTPEMLFLDHKVNFPMVKGVKLADECIDDVKDEKSAAVKGSEAKLIKKYKSIAVADSKQDVIVLYGAPGSGKSSFYRQYLSSYTRLANDVLNVSDKKFIQLAQDAISSGKNVVIDNTNSKREKRVEIVELARKLKVDSVRCLVLTTSKDVCLAQNALRKVEREENMSKAVPSVAIHTFFKRAVPPTGSEGFDEIIEVSHVPHETMSDEQFKRLIKQADDNTIKKQ